MLRNDLNERSKGLCTEQAKLTEWLFGDELKENLRDAELGERIARSSSKNWGGNNYD